MIPVWEKGVAFIWEGQTEKEFYTTFLDYLCNNHNTKKVPITDKTMPGSVYEIDTKAGSVLIKSYPFINGISQIPKSTAWVKSQCIDKHHLRCRWCVFLCYDKRDYIKKITKFNKGDWKAMKATLRGDCCVVDVAADAEIEDVMLEDIDGVCKYLGCESSQVQLRGSRGKEKMKNLFRDNGLTYHEGERARPLIDKLDMGTIMATKILPLQEIEDRIFK